MSSAETREEGLYERTLPGLHDALFRIFQGRVPPPGPVLDLGAGSGAWAARLLRHGYKVTSVERDPQAFSLPGSECLHLDLNDKFSTGLGGRRFRAITSIEVIEHLENPRAFLRECRELLESDGVLLFTTPNIENVPARLRFLASGELRLFGRDPAYNDPTHITPIHTFMLEKMLQDTGFSLETHAFDRPRAKVSQPLYRVISAMVDPLLRGSKGGDCHIFVIRKI